MNMDTNTRKKIAVIHQYAVATFSEGDWYNLGQLTGSLEIIQSHQRLLRSMSFGDDDYEFCVAEVINQICELNPENIDIIIDFYDIDLWFEQKDPQKYHRIFSKQSNIDPSFWKKGYLKAFISHLDSNKKRVGMLKQHMETWGISCFVAHQDIEPTKEWMEEIETGLSSMDLLIAIVEPKFKESNWTDQEVGYALGKQVVILPIRVGADPYGFMGKFQGIQAKGKMPGEISKEIIQVLVKKPTLREKLISAFGVCFNEIPSEKKIERLTELNEWNILTDSQMKNLLEISKLNNIEKESLKELVSKYNAYEEKIITPSFDSDIPF
ncbi:MAG: TIR domain-containing protein [Candidatus Cloacimonetes bacterium]|nr:TIR domain-containing protein [Candidatus Cloacimonadota bacterium]